MNVILLDIAAVSKDYQGCLPKPSGVSVWSLRRDQTEFTCPAVPSLLLVTVQSPQCVGQGQPLVLAGRATTLFAQHTAQERGLTPLLCRAPVLSTLGAWHCLDSCSSLHFKQSTFTGSLYLPLTLSYTITLMFFLFFLSILSL